MSPPSDSRETHTSSDDWDAISQALNPDISEAAAISVLKGFANGRTPNRDIAVKAVRSGISRDDARRFRSDENLDCFLRHLGELKRECIESLDGIEQLTPADIERIFVTRLLSAKETLTRPLKGPGIRKLRDRISDFTNRVLHLLHASLEPSVEQAGPNQVDKAYDETVDRLWKRKHRRSHWGLIGLQIGAMSLLALHKRAYEIDPELGAAILAIGILLSIAVIIITGKK